MEYSALEFLVVLCCFSTYFLVGKQLWEEIIHHLCEVIYDRDLIPSLRWAMLARQMYLEIIYWTGWVFFFPHSNIVNNLSFFFFHSSGGNVFCNLNKAIKILT